MAEKRNVMLESARIARGNIQDLVTIDSKNFDAILVPGGFGAAKNLSSFGFKGEDMTVQSDVENALKQFHTSNKIIGLTCIAPMIAARVFGTKFGGPGLNLTLGKTDKSWPYNGSIDVATKFGNTLNTSIDVDGVCIDSPNKVYTTPAYMREDAKPHEVFEGIDNMVKMIAKAIK
jgi:enhancing lycopene biosynthesis protein 2